MKNLLPANRVAAIAAFLGSLAAGIAAIEGSLPTKWGNSAALVVSVLGMVVTVLHFMTGSQKFDALQAQAFPVTDPAVEAELAAIPESARTPDPPVQ